MLKIKEMPAMERPYEKLEKCGADALSDAELLAIIIKNGTRGETSVQIAQKLIKENMDEKGFYFLKRMNINELTKLKGIGKVKAIQLKAVFELSCRINKRNMKKIRIQTPIDVCNLIASDLKYELTEQVRILTTDINGYLIKNEVVAIGKNNTVYLDPKEVFKTAIVYSSANVIIIHNHPNMDPIPSDEDISYTKSLEMLGKELEIVLVDHVIVGNGKYLSLRNEGLMGNY